MLTQSLSPGALPEQVGSASCAFHAEQVLQTRISLGHNLRLASLPIAFYNQSWKWLWNVCVPELMRFFGVCWMSEGFVAISHAVKTQGSKITLLESSRTLDHGWKFLKGVVAGVNPAQIKLSGRAVILLFITVPILVFKFKPSVFWVDPTATEHEEGWESPFWCSPGAVRVQHPRKAKTSLRSVGESKSWVFGFDVCICSHSSSDALIYKMLC